MKNRTILGTKLWQNSKGKTYPNGIQHPNIVPPRRRHQTLARSSQGPFIQESIEISINRLKMHQFCVRVSKPVRTKVFGCHPINIYQFKPQAQGWHYGHDNRFRGLRSLSLSQFLLGCFIQNFVSSQLDRNPLENGNICSFENFTRVPQLTRTLQDNTNKYFKKKKKITIAIYIDEEVAG